MKGILPGRAAAALVTVAVALGAPAAHAEAEGSTFVQHLEVSNLTKSPCTAEPVLLNGFLNQALHVSTDANGGQHVSNTLTGHLRGETADGQTYIFNETSVVEANVTAAEEFTVVQRLQFVRTGEGVPEDDFFLLAVTHVTLNANGEPTSSVVEIRSECE
jgi:hypothetical protein